MQPYIESTGWWSSLTVSVDQLRAVLVGLEEREKALSEIYTNMEKYIQFLEQPEVRAYLSATRSNITSDFGSGSIRSCHQPSQFRHG